MRDRRIPAANVWGAQLYLLEQWGFRKLVDTTFMMGFLVSEDAEPDDLERYFRGLRRAQAELDLEPEPYKRHWLAEMPDDLRKAAGERLDVVDAAVRVVLLLSPAADRLLKTGRAEDLHRAELEVARARVDRGARVPLNRQAADSVEPQEQRGREADKAAADDQDIRFVGAHKAGALCTVSTSSR